MTLFAKLGKFPCHKSTTKTPKSYLNASKYSFVCWPICVYCTWEQFILICNIVQIFTILIILLCIGAVPYVVILKLYMKTDAPPAPSDSCQWSCPVKIKPVIRIQSKFLFITSSEKIICITTRFNSFISMPTNCCSGIKHVGTPSGRFGVKCHMCQHYHYTPGPHWPGIIVLLRDLRSIDSVQKF